MIDVSQKLEEEEKPSKWMSSAINSAQVSIILWWKTSVRVTFPAEAPLPVCVVAGGGRTPRPAVCPPIFGALSVRLLHEGEGEDAELAIGRHCRRSKHGELETGLRVSDLSA